jgi:ERCC4-type nuclease
MTEGAFRIVVDTREQAPLRFGAWPTVAAGLRTGDYSIEGFEDRVAVERKGLSDLFTCVGRERPRFERELVRLAAMDYGAVVLEATLA